MRFTNNVSGNMNIGIQSTNGECDDCGRRNCDCDVVITNNITGNVTVGIQGTNVSGCVVIQGR